MKAAWERLQKIQKIQLLEATHAKEPEKMRQAIFAELNPETAVRPVEKIIARAKPATPADRARAAALIAAAAAS